MSDTPSKKPRFTSAPANDGDEAFAAPRNTEVMSPGEAPAPARPSGPRAPHPRYEVGSEFARGGVARVLTAVDTRLGRTVAIKEPLAGGADIEQRFRTEALIAARLQHPAIVPVYDAGQWPNGAPYYAMKLVSGKDLDTHIRDSTTLRDRLALLPVVLSATDAIAYAHSEGVIHRDLKPSNVLIGPYGETLVIDWGLAKEVQDAGATASGDATFDVPAQQTLEGAIMGTPVYMPPEQARGEPVDERADVYALGAVLYHLLAGRPPYGGRTAADALSSVLAAPPPPLELLDRSIPEDLVAVVDKAMARDPNDRYSTAEGLAADLHRFQTGQLVSARSYSARVRIRRWVDRHRSAVFVLVAAVAALLLLATLSVHRIVQERDVAELATKKLDEEHRSLLLEYARSSLFSDPTASIARLAGQHETGPVALGIAADAWSRGVARHVQKQHQSAVRHLLVLPLSNRFVTATDGGDIRVWSAEDGTSHELSPRSTSVLAAAVSKDGRHVAVSHADGGGRIWNLGDGQHQDLGTNAVLPSLAFGPRGQLWATTDAGGRVRFAKDGKKSGDHSRAVEPSVGLLRLSDGTIAGGLTGGRLALWGAGAREVIEMNDPRIVSLRADRNGRVLLVSTGMRLFIVDRTDKTAEPITERRAIADHALEPHGRWLATATTSGGVELVDVATRRVMARLTDRHPVGGRALAFSPDGRRLAAVSDENDVKIWSIVGTSHRPTVILEQHLRGHRALVSQVAFSADGTSLVTASVDGEVRVWDTEPVAAALDDSHFMVRFDESCSLVSLDTSGTLRTWTPGPGGAPVVLAGPVDVHGETLRVSTRAETGSVAFVTASEEVRVYDRFTGGAPEAALSQVSSVAVAPDGAHTAVAQRDGTVSLLSSVTGEVRPLGDLEQPPLDLVFSPDGSQVAAAMPDGGLRFLSLADKPSASIPMGENPLEKIVFSASGDSYVAVERGGTCHWRDAATGAEWARWSHRGSVHAVAFAAGGERVASAGQGGDVHVVRRDAPSQVLRGHQAAVLALAFTPDGAQVVSGGADATLRIWDVATATARVVRVAAAVDSVCLEPTTGDVLFGNNLGVVARLRADKRALPWLVAGGERAWISSLTTAVSDHIEE